MQWTRLKGVLETDPIPPPSRVPTGELAYRDYARAATARNIRSAMLLVLACSVLSPLADPIVLARIPDIAARMYRVRAGHVAITIAAYLLLRVPAIARRPLVVGVPAVVGSGLLFGYYLGLQGDLDTPWLHLGYGMTACTLLLLAPLAWRLLFALSIPASLLAGFALARPLLPPHPMLPPTLGMLAFTSAIALTASHFINGVVRKGFAEEQTRKATARALADLNATLEQRVRGQTRELRMLAAHLETTREDERARIARELHDELGQELTALRYALTFLKQRYERDPRAIAGNVEELDSLLARTSTTVRQIVSELRPRILDDLGLDAGVEWLVKRTEARTGLTCRLVMTPRALSLDAEVSIAAFRILQESLTNVVRHARATHVDVEVSIEGSHLCLVVEDDGVGMPEGGPARPSPGGGGMGLLGMRERADALGGELQIESRPRGGTVVRVRLPTSGREPEVTP